MYSNFCKCNYPDSMMYREMPTVKYCDSYDSYYCVKCVAWFGDACKCGEECEFYGRPDNPSDWYGFVEDDTK